MKIEPHLEVLTSDLPGIYEFIARDDPAAAERVLDAVEATFDQLVRQPESGVVYPTRVPRLQGLRMLPVRNFPNYLVFYRLEADVARILYVVAGARKMPLLFRRQPRS